MLMPRTFSRQSRLREQVRVDASFTFHACRKKSRFRRYPPPPMAAVIMDSEGRG